MANKDFHAPPAFTATTATESDIPRPHHATFRLRPFEVLTFASTLLAAKQCGGGELRDQANRRG